MRFFVLFIVFFLITIPSSATMLITVNNETNHDQIDITLNDVLNIGLWGDGQTYMGTFYMGIEKGGTATLDISSANILYNHGIKPIIFVCWLFML